MKQALAIFASLLALAAGALGIGDRVENFKLLDHNGQAHELHYLSDARAVVLMAHATGCSAFAGHRERFDTLAETFRDQGVAFLMVNGEGAARDALAESASAVPVLDDTAGVVQSGLELSAAGEVLIIDPSRWLLAHRGGGPNGTEIEQVLADFLAGREIAHRGAPPTDCPLAVSAVDEDLNYVDDVAPVLIDNCVTCHREGGIGPWAMTDYDMVRGFAPMIREVVRTKRMPPWHADPYHGKFENDRSLTADEVRALVHWAEAGTPRGEGADPLATFEHDWPQWAMGEPDLVLDIPAFDVPASGVVAYQYQRVQNPLDRDVWVRGTEISPGDRAALHHVITRFTSAPPEGGRGFGRRGGGLGGYVPGRVSNEFPPDTGTLLPAGATIIFQMHYTPYGKATTDRSRLGLFLHDEPPAHKLSGAVLANTDIRIPPGAKAHREFAEREFKQDILLYSLLPHAHYRGKASEFRAFYPDKTEELLLSVPNYDFNWQTTYVLEEPKLLPAGTKVVHTTWWDNSAQNPANPDPTREVPWGLQSWDEMLFGSMSFRVLEGGMTASRSPAPSGSSQAATVEAGSD